MRRKVNRTPFFLLIDCSSIFFVSNASIAVVFLAGDYLVMNRRTLEIECGASPHKKLRYMIQCF